MDQNRLKKAVLQHMFNNWLFPPFHLFNQKKNSYLFRVEFSYEKKYIIYKFGTKSPNLPSISSELENYLEYNTAEYKVLIAANFFSNQKCSCANLSYFSILSWQMPLTFSCLCDYYMVDEVLKEDYLVSCSSPITN